MNKWILILLVSITVKLSAQTNAPVRLAVISESAEVMTAADVLTAQLSNNGKIQLLERDQIEKVYRELGLSAANRDDLKLGRILGADGLLLLHVVRTPQATNLMARLIAVKPGVVLTDGSFPWPLKNTPQWAESVAAYLKAFLPKLSLLAKDAIPISIVNLRAAISSVAEKETERDLKLLTIQRLSQERRFFVLERQKMQLLSNEKELKSDESAFWDGSYLLDGIIDQSGYSPETVTINVRLTPPKGGAPLRFEVSGSRTNLAEVVNRLATKVTKLLNVHSTVPEWTAANEAAQYFDEAKWALRWGVYSEAQASADSAWALGKRDRDCAMIRVKSYILQVTANVVGYERGENSYDCIGGYDSNNRPLGPPVSKSVVEEQIKQIADEHPYGLRGKTNFIASQNLWIFNYALADRPPDPKNIECALHALDLYYQFSRNSPKGLLKVASAASNWKNSAWYNLGIQDLIAASKVLRDFNFVPKAQKPVADELADLRALARSVAEWIFQTPAVRKSYFVGNRLATHDELDNTMIENPNIFRCEINWGCFWQEHPEDTIALYRHLMSSPVFCYIHENLWLRPLERPRLVAWNEADQKRIPIIWNNFVLELGASSNVFLQLEAKGLQVADARNEKELATTFTNLFDGLFANSHALVANNVEVLYLDWGVDELVSSMTGNGIVTDTKESLNHLFYSKYMPRLQAMDQEYWQKTVPRQKEAKGFEAQVKYLKNNTPYNFFEFNKVFAFQNYTKAQAAKLLPLVAAYRSNLVAQAEGKSRQERFKAKSDSDWVELVVGKRAKEALNPPAPPCPRPRIQAPKVAPVKVAAAIPPVTNTTENVSNVILVNTFFAIPVDGFVHLKPSEQIVAQDSRIEITAHQWFAGKLLLDFNYGLLINTYDSRGDLVDNRTPSGTGIAIFEPKTKHWDVIGCPEVSFLAQNGYYHRSALLNGNLFNCDGGQIMKYNFMDRKWKVLKISDGNNYELFVVNGHLYAANKNIIFEITDGGNATRILASTRRQPPVTALDTQDLGTPTLFPGPNHSLRVCTANKIFTWTGNDWRQDHNPPYILSPPEIFADGVLFRQAGFLNAGYQNGVIFRQKNGSYGTLVSDDEISSLANKSNRVILCLSPKAQANPDHFFLSATRMAATPKPLWKTPANMLPNLPVALHESDLYVFENSFAAHVIINDHHQIFQENAAAKGKYNAVLLCFSPGLPLPQKIFLKFTAPNAQTPTWMFPTTNFLLLGSEASLNHPLGTYVGDNGRAGVWMVPIRDIESRIAAQRRVQRTWVAQEKKQALAAAEQHQKVLARQWQELLAKYDLNHNGRIDPDEREAALADPIFIKFELSKIDINHNDRLDAQELAWFDANHNGILDPPEEAGIAAAQKLLAQKLIKDFGQNGELDEHEFAGALAQNSAPGMAGQPAWSVFSIYDRNHDHELDAGEVQSFLKQYTLLNVRRKIFQTEPHERFYLLTHPRLTFKELLEMCWKGPDRGDHAQPNRQP